MSRPRIPSVGSCLLALSLLVPACRGKDTKTPQTDGATAQATDDGNDMPVILPERPLDYEVSTLANGMQVITLEDASTPVAAVQVWYHVGSKDEKPNRRGFAHMFEHMMFRGTQNIGPKAHFEYIRKVGGNANAYTSFDNTTYIQVVPSNQVDMVLWLEAERMAFLKINDDYFDTERKVVAEEYRRGQEQPYGSALEKVLAGVFEKHPYRWSPIGDMNELGEADAKELQEFWNTFYVPNNAALVVVGDVKHKDVLASAEKYFGWIPKYDEPPRVEVREPAQTEAKKIKIKERNGPVPIVALGYRTVPLGHEDELALEMLGTILGGGESSRLWRSLVREQDLAMFALAGGFTLEHDGLFAAGAVLSPFGSSAGKALDALRAEVERIKKDGITDEELLKARNGMLASEVQALSTVQSKAQRLGEAAVLRKDLPSVNTDFKAITEITADDIQRVANTYLVENHEIEVRIEPNMLGFLVDQIRGGDDKGKSDDGDSGGEETIRGEGSGKPGLTRPEGLGKAPVVAPPLSNDLAVKKFEKTLDNGLEVVVLPSDEVPFVTMWMGLEYGSFADPEGKQGTAYLTLPMLGRGTKTHDYEALTDELDRYAITLSGSAGLDSASIYVGALNGEADRAMQMLSEVIREPTFPKEELDEFVGQTTTGLMVTERSPDYLADREMRRRLYGEHPAARLPEGTAAGLRKLTRDDLETWWGTYARPDSAKLYIAGAIEPEAAFELAQAHLSSWEAKGDKPSVSLPAVPKPAKTKIFLVDRKSNQSQIRVGQTSITRKDARYPTARVVTEYFGGGFNARLNDTIRVKKGLTYGAGGGFSPGRFVGGFRVSTFSKTATVAQTVQTILEEIDRLQKEAPSSSERDDSISYIVGSFAASRETPQSLIRDLWRLELNDLPEDYYAKYLEAIRDVSPDAAVTAAKDLVDPDALVIVVVGPADKLKPALSQIADVEVVDPNATK